MESLAKAERAGGLLAWQYGLYPGAHASRTNLLLHAATAPLYLAGTVVLAASLLTLRPLGALAGVGLMAATMAAQKRGHGTESVTPKPFLGPGDLLVRLFVEQWVTFPRYVLSGGFGRAWRASSAEPAKAGQHRS